MTQLLYQRELVKCPICLDARNKSLFSDRNRRDRLDFYGTYVQCLKCSLVYLSNPPSWETLVQLYSSSDQTFTAASGRQDPERIIEKVKSPIPVWRKILKRIEFRSHSWPLEVVPPFSKRLLDIGCGDGERLFEFSRRGYEVWGIDVGAHSIDVCRRILPKAQFFQGELQEASLEAGQFDFVRIDNALEHMPNPGIVIMETYRILKSSGKIMIYVPNGRSFTMRFLKGGSISSWMPFHLQLFTKRSLFKLLQDNGFKDIKIYGYNPPTWIPMSIIQSLNISRNRVPPSYPKWLDKVFLPLGWIFVCIGLSEELMAVAVKKGESLKKKI